MQIWSESRAAGSAGSYLPGGSRGTWDGPCWPPHTGGPGPSPPPRRSAGLALARLEHAGLGKWESLVTQRQEVPRPRRRLPLLRLLAHGCVCAGV